MASHPGQTPQTPYLAKTEKAVSRVSAAAPVTDLPWIRQTPSAALPQQVRGWGSPPQCPQAQQNGSSVARGALLLQWGSALLPSAAPCSVLATREGTIYNYLLHILQGNKKFNRQGLDTCAPSIPLVHSNMAGTHFHPHFSFSNPCGGAVSSPHEATE